MKTTIIPLKGLGEITFGMTPDEVVAIMGNPEYYEEIDNEDEAPILYYEYEDLGLSIYFEQDGENNILTYFETENEDVTLFDTKIFSLTSKQLIELMKNNGLELSERDDDQGETSLSFDDIMTDFFFEGEKMTAVSWSAEWMQNAE